jgi:hypothetical protein
VIPIYPRRDYHAYLRGTEAVLTSVAPPGAGCPFTLEFEEFTYSHPDVGFDGRFQPPPARTIRFALAPTASPDLYSGTAYHGATRLGAVSIRWISPFLRRAHLQLNTLEGAVAPPAEVEGASLATILADVGWELTVTDAGTVPLPAELSGVQVNDCWTQPDLIRLMASVPGFNPDELDSVWRVHLVAIPARLGCDRGWMFQLTTLGEGLSLARLGAATYSHDGYPSTDGPHYDAAADQQQRNVPKAYLRSAAHEVGHAFNQIHQEGAKGGPDNSIMTTTPKVARVLGTAGLFPDHINLAFNERVRNHLHHLPDPVVRPGAMNYLSNAMSVGALPEAGEYTWLDELGLLKLTVEPSSDRIALGEPITLTWTLTNRGSMAMPVPAELTLQSLVVVVSVTDPCGKTTSMKPADLESCPKSELVPLEPGASRSGSARIYWGTDDFAFATPGRHTIEVIVQWVLESIAVAVSETCPVFVTYPTSAEENEIAALLLDRDVGLAVALGDPTLSGRAAERINQAAELAPEHRANQALERLGLHRR